MAFMAGDHFGAQIISQGLAQEIAVGGDLDRDQPGQDQKNGQDGPGPEQKRLHPAGASFPGKQRNQGQAGNHGCDGALEQGAQTDRKPEDQADLPVFQTSLGDTGPQLHQGGHGEGRRAGQHGIGLGDSGLDAQKNGSREQGRSGKRRLSAHQSLSAPEGRQRGEDSA